MAKHTKIPQHLQPWIEARRKHRLSHMHVQMARELGINPKKLGKIDNHRQEPWKEPLPNFIETLYFKRFGRERPEVIRTVDGVVLEPHSKKQEKKAQDVAWRESENPADF